MTGRRLHPAEIQRLLVEAEQNFAQGNLAETEAACRQVLATAPDNPLANHYLGAVAFVVGQHEIALQLLKRATEVAPNVAPFYGTYAEALSKVGRYEDALIAIRSATRLDPARPEFQYHHGALAGKLGHVEESIVALKAARKLLPNFPGAANDLGLTLTSARRIDEALQCFRDAIALDPNYRTAHDNIIYFSHFASGIDGMTIKAEAERWAKQFAEPLKSQHRPHDNDRSPDRKLRVGYVSPDLYEHPVGRFMQPLLAHHDRDAFEVLCYSDVVAPDAHSQTLKQSCEHWIDSASLDDDALAAKIREDRIDVLIDLSLHMGGNRMLVFARKPAPVQTTYLGYAGTSGMTAMDWRISDPYLDPPGNERFYTEKTYRLPRSYWCFAPPPVARTLEPSPPRDGNVPITFACLNNIVKISDAALESWAQILANVPNSRIIIQGEPGEHLRVMAGFFERAGVDPARVEFAKKTSLPEYFRLYQRIDIALDPFPYAGGTTTCDAVWMGVPVVSLAGEIAVHRGGVSILTNLGLTGLIAHSVQEYANIATELAQQPERRINLQSNLRQTLQRSVLSQPTQFVSDLEAAYREIWRRHCLA